MEFYQEMRNTSKYRNNRYKDCSILKDVSSGDSLLSTRLIYNIPVKSSDLYHEVKSHEVNRLDIIAHKYYRDPLLWWIIAQANDIYDPLKPMEIGVILRIPSIETLYGNNGILL